MDDKVIDRIRSIIERHFNEEIEYKTSELELISKRIQFTKRLLDKLRAAIVSKYFASSDFNEESASEHCVHPTVRAYFAGKTVPATSAHLKAASYHLPVKLGGGLTEERRATVTKAVVKSMERVKFVIGNVSKYIGDEDPEDSVSHLWMAYVRLYPNDDPLTIEDLVTKVRFFLHPSYIPHHVVDVSYPYHLKRKGWGEFSLRAQLHFVNPLNKPVDVIHELKLDKFKRGIQTNGGETIFDVMLVVEREVCSPEKKSELTDIKPEPREDQKIKTEPPDDFDDVSKINLGSETSQPSAYPHRKHSIPRIIDLEAHGHDYCIATKSSVPYLLAPGDPPTSADKTQDGAACVHQEEYLLKPKCSTRSPDAVSTAQSPPVEVASSWEASLNRVDFSQDLHTIVDILAQRFFPLVGQKSVPDLCYQVGSVAEFLSAPVGKKRAVEWSRASHIRNALIRHNVPGVPGTRSIQLFLRKHGYTPLHESTTYELPKLPCPAELLSLSSYTRIDVSERLAGSESSISTAGRKPRLAEANVVGDAEDIDVTSLQSEQSEVQPDQRIAVDSPVLRFIYDNIEQILPDSEQLPTERSELDTLLHVTKAATMSFASQLLRRSLAEAFSRNASNFEIDAVLPADVHSAVCAHHIFDFLSNDGLGEVLDSS